MSAATVGTIAAVATAGVGVASAAGAFSPGAPGQVDYGQQTAAEEQAQINLLPQKLAASQTYDPQLAAVQQGINWNNLFGTPAGTRPVTTTVATPGFINSQTGQFVAGTTNPGGAANGTSGSFLHGNGQATSNPWTPTTQQVPTTQNIPVAATPGTLDMAVKALPVIDQLSAQANTDARTANIADVQNLGPSAMAALKAFDPQSAGLADTLAAQAQSELAAGSSLTPSQQQEDSQYVRAGQAARGLGVGPTDAYTEAFTLGQAGQNLLQQRQAFAGNVVNQRSQIYGDPFLAITGQSSGRNTSPTQFNANLTSPTTTAIDNGQNSALQVATNNNNLVNQANIAGFNQQQAGIGALAKTNWGSLFGQTAQLFGNGTNASSAIGTQDDIDLG